MAIVTRLERKSRRWSQVWQGDSEVIATIVAGRLAAEGIRTRIEGHATPYRTAALGLAGYWAILVPAGRAGLAREVLRDHDEGHNVIDEEPAAGLTESQRATLRFVGLLAAATLAVIAAAWLIQIS